MKYKKKIDLSTFTALLTSFIILGLVIFSTSNHFSVFIDFQSIMIVVFGTFFITAACFSITEIFASLPLIGETIFFKITSLHEVAIESLKYAEFARKLNSIKLEDKLIKQGNDSILTKGILLLNQSEKLENVEKILNQEILTYSEEKENIISIIRKAAEISPAMGLIGTLIGLVQMLSNLSDPSDLGPSMAIALLTTFYGAMLSYMLFFPIASKIERNAKDEIIAANILLQTVLSISKAENPRYLENMINSLLNPSERIIYFK